MTQIPPEQPKRLVISSEDLDSTIPVNPQAYTAPRAAAPMGPGGSPLPPLGAAMPAMPVSVGGPAIGGQGLARLGSNSIVSGLLAGAVGGVIGMICAEVLKNPGRSTATSQSGARIDAAIWVAIFGTVFGFVLLAWDGFTSGSPQKAWRDGAKGAIAGAVAGFVGGYVAQWLYASMLHGISIDASLSSIENKLREARVVGWALFGGLLGLGMGVRGGSKLAVNGLIGGTIGAALGGLIFEQIEISQLHSSSTADHGFMVRFVGLAVTGIGIGLGIGLVERIRRDSWLLITSGPMAGKEFILYNASTTVGSDFRSDIVLVKDRQVAPNHLAFLRDPGGAVTIQATGVPAVVVNGLQTAQQRLRSGDTVSVGGSTLVYQERAAST